MYVKQTKHSNTGVEGKVKTQTGPCINTGISENTVYRTALVIAMLAINAINTVQIYRLFCLQK